MNETIKTILKRRSIRYYLTEQIKPEELDLIIKAGLYSPSAHNQQPWHFTVIQDKTLIDELSKDTKLEMLKQEDDYSKKLALNEKFNLFYNAPTIVIVSGEKSALVPNVDSSAATENMLIAAESLNIGTCWIGFIALLFISENFQKYISKLNIPEGYEPYYAVSMGYKGTDSMQPSPRRENTVNYIK